MFDLITIGDCTIDTFIIIDHDEARLQCNLKQGACQLCLNYADKIPIKHAHQTIGGNASNVAVGVHKLGLKTAVVTEVGDDLNGWEIETELHQQGIDTEMVKKLAKGDTRYNIVLSYLSERTILSSQVIRNYQLPKLPPSHWLYYTSLLTPFHKLQNNLIKHLKKQPQIKLAANPGSHQLKAGKKEFIKILPYLEVLFVNKEEANKILDKKLTIKQALKSLYELGIKIVVITDGRQGTYAFNGHQYYFMPIYPVTPKERTGAGDALASGFLGSYARHQNISEALMWGTANAAGVIQKIGAEEGLMTTKEILKMIKNYPNINPKLI
jgi:ribokinase